MKANATKAKDPIVNSFMLAAFSIAVYLIGFGILFLGFLPKCGFPSFNVVYFDIAKIVIMGLILGYTNILFKYKPNWRLPVWGFGGFLIIMTSTAFSIGLFCPNFGTPPYSQVVMYLINTAQAGSGSIILMMYLIYIFGFGYWAVSDSKSINRKLIITVIAIILFLIILFSLGVL
jgi:hypothetical protein